MGASCNVCLIKTECYVNMLLRWLSERDNEHGRKTLLLYFTRFMFFFCLTSFKNPILTGSLDSYKAVNSKSRQKVSSTGNSASKQNLSQTDNIKNDICLLKY